MIGGKRFRTLREAKKHLAEVRVADYIQIYRLPKGKAYKYFVGSHLEWLNYD